MRAAIAAGLVMGLAGCGAGLSQQTYRADLQPMLTALDGGDSTSAARLLDARLAQGGKDHADRPLWLLERAVVRLGMGDARRAAEDLAAADSLLEVLSLSPDRSGELAKWLFSESVKRYKAPAYEKLMVNVLGIVARLGAGDFQGARVEAKRLHAMDRYFETSKDGKEGAAKSDPGGVRTMGRLLAGLAFELSGRRDIARRWYDEAVAVGGADTPQLKASVAPDGGEIVVVVMSGRVPPRRADKQGDANIVVLSAPGPRHPVDVTIGNGAAESAIILASVEATARNVYQEAKPAMVAAAKSRATLRNAASKIGGGEDATVPASGSSGWSKMLGGLVARTIASTMEQADVPDTRSWHTLPARLSVLRRPVSPGDHRVVVQHGAHRLEYDVPVQTGRRSLVLALLR